MGVHMGGRGGVWGEARLGARLSLPGVLKLYFILWWPFSTCSPCCGLFATFFSL